MDSKSFDIYSRTRVSSFDFDGEKAREIFEYKDGISW